MTDGPGPAHPNLFHELAEGLQAAGSYLAAARRLHDRGPHDHSLAAEVVEKAAAELARAQKAFHHLRVHLSEARAAPGFWWDDPESVPASDDQKQS